MRILRPAVSTVNQLRNCAARMPSNTPAPRYKHPDGVLIKWRVEVGMIVNPTPERLRTCRSCGEPRPLAEFRLRSRQTGERRSQCRACWNKYIRQYRARQREAALTGFIRALAAASNVGRVSAVAQGLMRFCCGKNFWPLVG